MPLDWLNQPLDTTVSELIARKKRGKAIEVLRAQLQGKMAPAVTTRLQLCDLLVQAGREQEAVPILIGLADEFAGDGFVAKAIAILKRVERLDPGPHVEQRLRKLVHHQRVVLSETPSAAPEIGIEAIDDAADAAALGSGPSRDEPPPADVSAPEPEYWDEEEDSEPSPAIAGGLADEAERPGPVDTAVPAEPLDSAEPVAGPAPVAEPEAEPEPVTDAQVAATATGAEPDDAGPVEVQPGEAEPVPVEAAGVGPLDAAPAEPPHRPEPGVAHRIRGVFRRFLASLGNDEKEEQRAAPEAVPSEPEPGAEPLAAHEPVGTTSEPETEPASDLVSVEPEPALDAEPVAAAEPEAEAVPVEIEAEATPAEADAEIVAEAAPEPEAEAVPEIQPEATPAEADEAVVAEIEPEPELEVVTDPEDMPEERFQEALLDIVEEVLHRPRGTALEQDQVAAYAQRLLATELFGTLSEDELLAIVQRLRLHTYDPGDVLVTEDEPGRSLFVLTQGRVRVYVRNPTGHSFEVAQLGEGDFFGEMSILSGRPRAATIVAASPVEVLELDRAGLDQVAFSHPRVGDVLESAYIRRASQPEAAAVRAVPLQAGDQRKAIEALESYFGESRWDPRMRLRLADVLVRAGKDDEAVPILVGLADDLAREGFPEKAVAILKKIEQLQRRHQQFVNLAPLPRAAPETPKPRRPSPLPEDPSPAWLKARTDDRLHDWLLDVLRHRVVQSRGGAEAPAHVARGYSPGVVASPLFEDFDEEELLAFIRSLRLVSLEPGEIVVSEGEPGDSVFILSTGTVKVFVRDTHGHGAYVCALGEGSFFGEMSALSGRPRSATVTAAAPVELLELERDGLDRMSDRHPRMRRVLEEFSSRRAADPTAQAIRTSSEPA